MRLSFGGVLFASYTAQWLPKNLLSIKPFDEKIYKDKIHYVQIVSIPLVWLHTTRALPLREAVK